MAETRHYEPRGSWILKILIVILVVALVASVLYPQKLWQKQDALTAASRLTMDNLNFVVQRHHEANESYIADLDSLLRFMENDSIAVKRATFEMDKMSLYDAPYDSFIVDFSDKFHFSEIVTEAYSQGQMVSEAQMESALVDSILLKMMPKPEFEGVVRPVLYKMVSPQDLHFYYPSKGVDDKSVIVWGDGKITRDYLPYEEYLVPSKEYLLTMPLSELRNDPITGTEYLLNLNTRLSIEGKIDYKMVSRGEPENPVVGKELYTNLFVNRLARQARSRLEQDMQKDTTLYEMQLELQGDYFEVEVELLTPRKTTTVDANTEVMTPVDSVESYQDIDRLRDMLFTVQYDSLVRVWTDLEMVQDVITKLTYTETIGVTSIDTIGVTIRPQMGDEYNLPSEGFLESIFTVGPIDNPGYIENNDLSWSETR
ncbi:hypothetical protein KQI52_07735 [bacterium]|nr:hypothetical protein [bacterium]